jgi:hypothetical protein
MQCAPDPNIYIIGLSGPNYIKQIGKRYLSVMTWWCAIASDFLSFRSGIIYCEIEYIPADNMHISSCMG